MHFSDSFFFTIILVHSALPSAPFWGCPRWPLSVRIRALLGGRHRAIFPLILAAAVGSTGTWCFGLGARFVILDRLRAIIEPFLYGRSSVISAGGGSSPSATVLTLLWVRVRIYLCRLR